MIRIADILGNSSEEDKPRKEKQEQGKQKDATPPPNVELIKGKSQTPPFPSKPYSPLKQEQEEPSLIELSKSMLDKVKLEGLEESRGLYNKLATSLKGVCDTLASGGDIDLTTANDNLSALIDQLALGNEEFKTLTNSPYEGEYLYAHMVNVSILSILIGVQAGFNKSRLLELSSGALLHDVGLIKFREIINAPRKLTKEEYEQIKQHTILGAEILKDCKGISKGILSIISGHHERLDGSGYPKRLKAQDIEDNAQIVALVNAYESLTHKRPFRDRILNSKAMRLMVEQKKTFRSDFLKLFIEAISIYPLNCWVRLSSDEIAKVVGINRAFLLKPKVEIFFDKKNKRLDSTKIIDLSKQPNIYVKEEIPQEAVEFKLED
ncbi:MAG: HD domain-containing protein [Candidatus Omnitrophica bacterium]|nr:HD domain-containing protein [Candidatus Omnitrophota bacterium]